MSTGIHLKTAGDLIRDALRAANISGISLQIDPTDFAQGQTALNDILSWLQTKQIHLWSETEAYLPLNPNQRKYSFPGDHAFTDGIFKTTTAANYAALDFGGELLFYDEDLVIFYENLIRLDSVDGIEIGQNVGIELSNGTRFWSTVETIDEDDLFITIASDEEILVNEDASVIFYETAIDQPVRVLDARYASSFDADETPMEQMARKTYYDQPSKGTQGSANSWYYDRQLSVGHLNVWPVASSAAEVIRFTFIKPQYIPEDQTENILVPPEWYLPLKNKLAAELGVIYAVDLNKQAILEAKAESFIEDALGTDDEFSNFQFYPDRY